MDELCCENLLFLEFDILKIFVVIVDIGNFMIVVEVVFRMFLVVFMQIKKFEDMLGVMLF